MNDLAAAAQQHRTLGPRLEYWADRQPDKLFARCNDLSLTWRETEQRSAQLAAGLQALGVAQGDRVALFCASRIELVLSLLALGRMGAVAVPLNTYLKGEFLRFQLKDCAAATAIVDAEGLASLAAIADDLPDLRIVLMLDQATDPTLPAAIKCLPFAAAMGAAHTFARPELLPRDPAAILYTSGTTGMPKGCVCGQGYLMVYSLCALEDGWMRNDDVLFCTFPLFHSAGYFLVLGGTIQSGASLVIEPAFSASAFTQRVTDSGATVVFGVGAIGMAVLAAKESSYDRRHKLRLCSLPPMPPASQEAFEARFGCDVISCAYGQTELAPITHLSAAEAKHARASLGRPSHRLDVRVVDDQDQPVAVGEIGEIVARPREPDIMFQGYWQRPDATVATQRNLWHHTGDLGRLDADGLLHFVDRKKDSMRRRGENVSSIELERALIKHPAIAAVVTHAVPSELGEDDIKACIILAEGAEVTPGQLFEFFSQNLPYYAVPRYVEFMTAFPTNAIGRVMKPILRERGIGEALDLEAMGFTIARDARRG